MVLGRLVSLPPVSANPEGPDRKPVSSPMKACRLGPLTMATVPERNGAGLQIDAKIHSPSPAISLGQHSCLALAIAGKGLAIEVVVGHIEAAISAVEHQSAVGIGAIGPALALIKGRP